MDHHQGLATFGKVGIIAGMDSGTYGPQVIGVVRHVQESSGFQAAMTTGTADIAITVDIGARLANNRIQQASTKASKAFVLRANSRCLGDSPHRRRNS